MKQLLLRVDDDLHAKLASRARSEGRSVNALANEILNVAAAVKPESARDRLRSRAAAMGMLSVNPPRPPRPSLSRRALEEAVAATRGWGQVVDSILNEDRDRL